MSFKRYFLSLFLLCTSVSILPFWEDFSSFFGFDDEEPQLQSAQYCSDISPNIFKNDAHSIRLSGVTGKRKLPALYHLESYAIIPEEYGWLCGLHMLYNICQVERFIGISDITDDEFIDACERVPRVFHEKGSYPKDMQKIAKSIAWCPLYILEHTEDNETLDFAYGSSAENRFWHKVHAVLDKPGVQCVHFGCLIYDEDNCDKKGNPECHIFLISVIKMEDGRKALYLLDNMNRQASKSAQRQMFRHAEYIHGHIFN